MSEFHILCSSLVKISVLSGFFRFQNLSDSSKDYTSFFFIYFVLASMTGVWAIASNIHFVLTIDMFNARTIGVASAYSLSLFGSVYLMAHSKQIHLLMTDFHSLIKILTEDDLFKKGSESVIFHRAAKLDKILKFFLISYVSLPAGTTFFIYASHLKFGTIDMLYPVAYDVHNRPFLYEVTLFFQCTAAFVASGRLVSSIGFLFTMLFHLNLCLKQLRFSSKNVFQNKDNTDEQVFQHHSKLNQFGQYLHTGLYNYNRNRLATDNRYHNSVFDERYINSTERFREWVKIHKFILRLTKDLNSVYSPVLGSFLFTSFGIGIFIIFSCTMEDTALADKMGFLGFWFLFMGILLALCYCGTLLTHENSILLQDVQDVISVCGNSEIQKCALITGERIKKPLRISVFGSHYFDLSVDTFLWMVKSMASLYISIAQFRKINKM